jgi:preprotein translocase subunit SecE
VATRKDDDDYIEGQDDAQDADSDADESALEAEPAPERVSSSDVTSGTPAPRAARFGEGAEGRPARRERGVQGARAGSLQRAGSFWRDVRAELRRVTWPSMREVQSTTIITIIAVAFFAVYLWAVDQAWTRLLTGLMKLLGG